MSDDPRVRRLLDELLDSQSTPEEVCLSCPELLSAVRDRWRLICRARDELDVMFPPIQNTGAPPSASPTTPPVPVVPGYDVEAMIGDGGMGVVFRARDLRLKRLVALKTTRGGVYASASDRERFQREAEAVAALRHPNVIQIYDVGEADGCPFFTMEYVAGGNLGQKLGGTPLPWREAAEIATTLAGAVQAAHVSGIIHRDLKPANVMLTAEGVPKVTDFGLARRAGDGPGLTWSGTAIGTPSYMAPEQAEGRIDAVGPSADVYSLGAILYEMLTGRPPFRAETAAETVSQVLGQDPVPPSRLNRTVPRDLETICLKCLNKEPRLRYANAEAFADDLGRLLDGAPIRARPINLGARAWRWCRRRPAAASLIVAVTVFIGSAVGFSLWLERQQGMQRAATARYEGRTWQAVETALEQAAGFQSSGRWQEARSALAAAPSLSGTQPPAGLAERLQQTGVDVDTVIALENVRLAMSENRKSDDKGIPTGAPSYAAAFRNYGVDLAVQTPQQSSEVVRRSAIRATLLAYLHDWFQWATQEQRRDIAALLNLADDDQWRKSYREALAANNVAMLKSLAAAREAPDQPPLILSGLGGNLLAYDQRDAALGLLREAQRRHPEDFWINYLLGHFLERESPLEAVGYLRAAVAIRPKSDQAFAVLGRALRNAGDASGAVAALRTAVTLNPSQAGIMELAKSLARSGRLDEVRDVWEKFLESDPPDHGSWHGYAQLCLFVGDENAYRQARKRLLDRFGTTPPDWIIAERTVVACLLQPTSGEELRRAAALADFAVADAARFPKDKNPFVEFAAGLSQFRQGKSKTAIPLLEQSAARIGGRAGPHLVLAMAQFQSGSPVEARKTLAAAIVRHDWNISNEETLWVSHVLRREAEAMILPSLPPFEAGAVERRESGERRRLLTAYQSKGLYHAAARLCSDGFGLDPRTADASARDCLDCAAKAADPISRNEILNSNTRYIAARCAAQAGCGLGNDRAELDGAERTRWRRQSLAWLKLELSALSRTAGRESRTLSDLEIAMLVLWKASPDLKGVREPPALEQISKEEQTAWLAFWKEIDDVLKRSERPAR